MKIAISTKGEAKGNPAVNYMHSAYEDLVIEDEKNGRARGLVSVIMIKAYATEISETIDEKVKEFYSSIQDENFTEDNKVDIKKLGYAETIEKSMKQFAKNVKKYRNKIQNWKNGETIVETKFEFPEMQYFRDKYEEEVNKNNDLQREIDQLKYRLKCKEEQISNFDRSLKHLRRKLRVDPFDIKKISSSELSDSKDEFSDPSKEDSKEDSEEKYATMIEKL